MDRQTILAVDDNPTNLKLLEGVLRSEYKFLSASNGIDAIEICNSVPVDLVLLDIMMPEMDGYEVCQCLKEYENTREIPVIFVSAKSETFDEKTGFDVGGVDYIIKPIIPITLKARVKNHLELKNAREELARKNEQLLELAKLREDVERMTRHDLKGPLVGVINFPQIILKECHENLTEQQKHMLKLIGESGYRMLHMINNSLNIYKMEIGTYVLSPEKVKILPIIERVLTDLKSGRNFAEINTELICDPASGKEDIVMHGEESLCYSIFSNLILNSLQASRKGDLVQVTVSQKNDIEISIFNDAVVPADIRDTFFEKYVTFGKVKGTGLGTYSAKLMVQAQNGKISMSSAEGQGTTITMQFPRIAGA